MVPGTRQVVIRKWLLFGGFVHNGMRPAHLLLGFCLAREVRAMSAPHMFSDAQEQILFISRLQSATPDAATSPQMDPKFTMAPDFLLTI